ncbi:MAG: hypothetical protein BM563_06960 [Bacteroidetes bacterium MedPE-SWsnd-G1]|nr:MAG: hypothetical protein BM563_06960 [Bacteroidetes bacterium MedPE-SWsnd-G1]
MVGSIWRYSHFLVAAISAIFLLIASLSGAILAFEPISQSIQDYKISDFNQVTLNETIVVLKENYEEVLDIEVTSDDFVKASVFTFDGSSETIYINPITGEKLGDVKPQSSFFSFVTNFHRSLFLKSIGRGFVGVISFLLCIITITGLFLLAERQGGLKKWFTKVQEKDWGQRYHVILGRWFLIPIFILALTGVYLSAEKFSLLPNNDLKHATVKYKTDVEIQDFAKLKLSEIRKLVFPFSPDEEDYFELTLQDKEQFVHQYNGKVLSEASFPFVTLASRLSMTLHTGQGSILWSLILLISSLSMLFFMYSGLKMSIKRIRKKKVVLKVDDKDSCDFVLLIGSETGSTNVFASIFQRVLKSVGKKVFVASLNDYSTYVNAKQIIVFTATYGDGDAPSNARKFQKIFGEVSPLNQMKYSIVGFGSKSYPNYCQFADEVENLFKQHPNFEEATPLVKINDQSQQDFQSWEKLWNASSEIKLQMDLSALQQKPKRQKTFEVVERTLLNTDNTFLITLRPKKRTRFQSGDLLNILPPESSTVRQYSISKCENDILLSIKKHDKGICSTFLSEMKVGTTFKGAVEKNEEFHLPKKAKEIWMISNGTGIAPFLGMLEEAKSNVKVHFIWGGRTIESYKIYKNKLEEIRNSSVKLSIAYSKEQDKNYVQDIIESNEHEVITALENGAVFMLCGSVAMEKGVTDVLEKIMQNSAILTLDKIESNGQMLADCY